MNVNARTPKVLTPSLLKLTKGGLVVGQNMLSGGIIGGSCLTSR